MDIGYSEFDFLGLFTFTVFGYVLNFLSKIKL